MFILVEEDPALHEGWLKGLITEVAFTGSGNWLVEPTHNMYF